MKASLLPLFTLLALASTAAAQTSTTYSVLSTAYNRASGSFFPLGSADSYWSLTQTQALIVPNDPSSVVNYANAPTYVVSNAGNNTFPGIINDHSINYNTGTSSIGQKVVNYRTYFTLPNLNGSNTSYALDFRMSADDAVDHVLLNGVKKGQYLDAQYTNIPGVNKPYLLSIPACDTSFRSGQNYIDVTIADAGGSIGFYAEILLSAIASPCEKPVGIGEPVAARQQFSVHPNPCGSILTLRAARETGILNIGIYTIDGRLIREESRDSQTDGLELDTKGLPAGLYHLKIRSAQASQVLLFAKQAF